MRANIKTWPRTPVLCFISRFVPVVLVLLLLVSAQSEAGTILTAVPDKTTALPLSEVVVDINVDLTGTTERLGAYELELLWESDVLGYISASGGTTTGYTSITHINDKDTGSGSLLFTHLNNPGAGGVVNVARITFKVLANTDTDTIISVNANILSASDTFVDLTQDITVNNATITIEAKKPPLILTSSLPDAIEESDYYFETEVDPGASDDTLNFEIIEGPAWLSIDRGTGVLTGTPTDESVGQSFTVTIHVRNVHDLSDYKSLEISVENVNDPPFIITSRLPNATVNEYYEGILTVEDEDADDLLSYEIITGPEWMSANDDGTITGTPGPDDAGTNIPVTVRVTDQDSLYDELSSEISVISDNVPPEIVNETLPDGVAEKEYTIAIDVTDENENEVFTYQIIEAPDWLGFADDGLLTGTPGNGDAGNDITVTIRVTDNGGLFDELSALISVQRSDLGALNVMVTDALAGNGIGGAEVILGETYTSLTGMDGTSFFDEIPQGTYDLQVITENHQPYLKTGVTVIRDSTIAMSVVLKKKFGVANIDGHITDLNSGDPIVGATVAITPGGFSSNTDSDGYYYIASVPAGTDSYKITASANGFQTQSSNGLYISGAVQTVTRDFTLAAISAPVVNDFTPVFDDYPVVGEDEEINVVTTISVGGSQQGAQKHALMKSAGTADGLFIVDAKLFLNDFSDPNSGISLVPVDGAFDETIEQVSLNVDIQHLSDGTHTIYILALNSSDEWGYPASAIFEKGMVVKPPTNVETFDIPDDQGHRIGVRWDLSVSEDDGLVDSYRIFRSRNSAFEDPIALSEIETIEELLNRELYTPVLIDSVDAGVSEYIDSMIPINNVVYFYWIQAIGEAGSSKIAPLGLRTNVEAEPLEFMVANPFPNPFNSSTRLVYSLSEPNDVTVSIYTITGQKVKTLLDRHLTVGTFSVTWKGFTESGRQAGTGIYIFRISAGNHNESRRVLLLR